MKELKLKYFLSLIKEHKLKFFFAALILLILLGSISYIFIAGVYQTPLTAREPRLGVPEVFYTPHELKVEEEAREIVSKPREYKLKKGSVTIESKDAMDDYSRIQEKVKSLNGWIETMSKSEDYKKISVRVNLKIPSEDFDSFADWLVQNFEVESTNLEFYRVSIERQQDEIQILLEALKVYDNLLQRAEAMNVSKENIEIIMQITQKKLEVMRLLRQYGYSIEKVEEQAKYASLSLTLRQKKKIKLMPEEIGREFREKLRKSIREIVNAVMDLLTVPVTIFVKIIVWIIYAIIVLVPVFVAIKLVLKIFGVISQRMKT